MYVVEHSSYKYDDLLKFDYERINQMATGITKNRVEEIKFMSRMVNFALTNPKEMNKIVVEYTGKKRIKQKQMRPQELRQMGFREGKRKK